MVRITCLDREAANNATTNKFILESKYSITIPWYIVYRKVVIRGIPGNFTNEDIWLELKDSNPSLIFDKEDIYRFQRRTYVEGVSTFVNTTSVRLNLRASLVPTHVFLWKSRLSMSAYIPSIRQCFNCGQLSHSTKFCKNVAKCLTCGSDRHENNSECSNIPSCINCTSNHRSLSKECPEVIIKKKITEFMANYNMDYNSAKKLVLQGAPIFGQEDFNCDMIFKQRLPNPWEFPPLRKLMNNILHEGKAPQYTTTRTPSPNPVKWSGNFVDATKNLQREERTSNINQDDLAVILNKLNQVLKLFDNNSPLFQVLKKLDTVKESIIDSEAQLINLSGIDNG